MAGIISRETEFWTDAAEAAKDGWPLYGPDQELIVGRIERLVGSQRRIEGRIGQLLGEPEKGGRGKTHTHAEEFKRDGDRADFRIIARALDGECKLEWDEWRKSRRALVSLIRNRLGLVPELEKLPAGIFRCIVADPPF